MAIKLNAPNYYLTDSVLPPYKPELVDETQELFNSIPITTDIISNKICEESFYNNIAEKFETQNQWNDSEQFSSITETKIEIPESLATLCLPLAISLSSEFLIKSESDIDTLILLLQQKYQMSQEKLD
ncbi:10_t:CDS:1 [Diversispora eburnea]|uniref:10_t:CDS:1 n=1 Tax=Diversispora eburnea TaxID=1213867 RepID=A0A9N9GPY9_9GLOM|nr:10_t:CDS:1 [Diversispora eburnea]